jgi:catechol 2,3-dioxygenase-like lactoylglutathione lyase family enzyme
MITRRGLLTSFPLAAAARGLWAQSAKPPVAARRLSQMTLTVSDLKRSLDFYQGLFGAPIQARQGSTVLLRVGAGPQYLALAESRENAKPGISLYGMSVDGFNAGRIVDQLADHGIAKSDAAGPMKSWVKMRGQTAEVFVGDPDGIVIQLQDASFCGGTGALGNVCSAVQPAPRKGLLALRDLSHFTLFVSNAQRSRDFYQQVLGLTVQAYQGPGAPVLGVGTSRHFIMAAGGGGRGGAGAAPALGNINHGCFLMDGFDRDQIFKTLADYGLQPRGEAAGPAKALVYYVSMRMENRGGAKEGTAELYFTDPDGILLQLQDASYCGGAGVRGEVCL